MRARCARRAGRDILAACGQFKSESEKLRARAADARGEPGGRTGLRRRRTAGARDARPRRLARRAASLWPSPAKFGTHNPGESPARILRAPKRQRAPQAAGCLDVFRRGDDPERHRRGARRRPGHGGPDARGGKGAGRSAHCAFPPRQRELGGLEAALCKLHGLSEAIVAPLSSDMADATAPIAAALGDHVSALLRNDMKIGLGWGRTLDPVAGIFERALAQGPERRLADRRRHSFSNRCCPLLRRWSYARRKPSRRRASIDEQLSNVSQALHASVHEVSTVRPFQFGVSRAILGMTDGTTVTLPAAVGLVELAARQPQLTLLGWGYCTDQPTRRACPAWRPHTVTLPVSRLRECSHPACGRGSASASGGAIARVTAQ